MSETPHRTTETTPPVPPESAPVAAPELLATNIDESAPALNGLHRFVLAFRLSWATGTRDSRVARDKVATETAAGAQLIRGFGTPAEDRRWIPTNPLQLTTAIHRRGQARKSRKAAVEKWRISQVYGTKETPTEPAPPNTATETPTEPAPKHRNNRSTQLDSEVWDKRREKIAENDRPKVYDPDRATDPEHRTRRFESRAEKGAARRYKSQDRVINRRERRLHRAAEGNTVIGKVRKQLIKRSNRKVDDLTERLRGTPAQRDAVAEPSREPEPTPFSPRTPVTPRHETPRTTPGVTVHPKGKLFGKKLPDGTHTPVFYEEDRRRSRRDNPRSMPRRQASREGNREDDTARMVKQTSDLLEAVGARFDFAKVLDLDTKVYKELEDRAHDIKDHQPEKTIEDPKRPGTRKVRPDVFNPIIREVRTKQMQEFLADIYKDEPVHPVVANALDKALDLAQNLRDS